MLSTWRVIKSIAADPKRSMAAATEEKGPLGQKVDAPEAYAPHVLFPIPRAHGRSLLGLDDATGMDLPFVGEDVWNAYETSWLNVSGVPRRGTLELRIPATTPNLVESKSLKLYLNSLNFKRFASPSELLLTVTDDLTPILGGPSVASLRGVGPAGWETEEPPLLDSAVWTCVDDEDVGELPSEALDEPDDTHLGIRVSSTATGGAAIVTERLVSHLLRTRCPVTSQPDWGSVFVEYRGPPISRAGLLRYICSLRREIGFHECVSLSQTHTLSSHVELSHREDALCAPHVGSMSSHPDRSHDDRLTRLHRNAVERITLALAARCSPQCLRVTGRFFRRGGIDINPVRAMGEDVEATLGPAPAQIRVPGQ